MTIANFKLTRKKAATENISYRKAVKESWIKPVTWKTIQQRKDKRPVAQHKASTPKREVGERIFPERQRSEEEC